MRHTTAALEGRDGANGFRGCRCSRRTILDIDGAPYGTTASGGDGGGTVFEVHSFTESVVYSFKGSPDGEVPKSRLIDVNGVLRGTTEVGGNYHKGTVVERTPSGEESVLHSLGEKSDGADPTAGLTKNLRKLYGATRAGGDIDYGAVYEINESGAEKVIHSFGKGSDGAVPVGSLTNSNGVLYGATKDGPIVGSSLGNGTVFQITPSGDEAVLYRFADPPDGAHPFAKLLAVGDVLYGTTREGGKNNRGILFKITKSGRKRFFMTSLATRMGQIPSEPLIDVNGHSMAQRVKVAHTITGRSTALRGRAPRRYSIVSKEIRILRTLTGIVQCFRFVRTAGFERRLLRM